MVATVTRRRGGAKRNKPVRRHRQHPGGKSHTMRSRKRVTRAVRGVVKISQTARRLPAWRMRALGRAHLAARSGALSKKKTGAHASGGGSSSNGPVLFRTRPGGLFPPRSQSASRGSRNNSSASPRSTRSNGDDRHINDFLEGQTWRLNIQPPRRTARSNYMCVIA